MLAGTDVETHTAESQDIMAVQSFHSLQALSEHFNEVVYKDTRDDSLIIHEVLNNQWHRYAWTHGKRELKFVETLNGSDLPLLIQVYPALS